MTRTDQLHHGRSFCKCLCTICFLLAILLYGLQTRVIQSILLYAHVVNFPFWLSDTDYHGLPEARNIKITLPDGSHINGWHILPAGEVATRSALIKNPELRQEYFDNALRQADVVVLSLHGNAGNRGSSHRVVENRMLASQIPSGNCHVLTIDYRGFGDSMGWPPHWPSEESTAQDTIALWHWLEMFFLQTEDASDTCEDNAFNATPSYGSLPSVFIYGHSLGCATSIQLATYLSSRPGSQAKSLHLSGLIMVAPFTSVPAVARDYPYTFFLRFLPNATDFIARYLHFSYSNIKAITSVTSPILIVHGAQDGIIPVKHGRMLAEAYSSNMTSHCMVVKISKIVHSFSGLRYECVAEGDSVRYIAFVEVQDAGHNWVFTRREWLGTVPNFIDRFKRTQNYSSGI